MMLPIVNKRKGANTREMATLLLRRRAGIRSKLKECMVEDLFSARKRQKF